MNRPPEVPLTIQVAIRLRERGQACQSLGMHRAIPLAPGVADTLPPAANEPQLDPFELTQL